MLPWVVEAVDVQMVAKSRPQRHQLLRPLLQPLLLLGKLVEAPLASWAALVDAVERAMAVVQAHP